MLIRRVGWRALAAAAAAFAVPVLGYVLAFHAPYGAYNLTTSDGLFLWSRTTSFANCAVIKPPPDLRPLCPNRETSASASRPPPAGPSPACSASPPRPTTCGPATPGGGSTPTPASTAQQQARPSGSPIDAITAQPLDYLRVVGRDVLLTFVATDRPQGGASMTFTARPRIPVLPWYYRDDDRAYAGTRGQHPRGRRPTRSSLFLYQQPVDLPRPAVPARAAGRPGRRAPALAPLGRRGRPALGPGRGQHRVPGPADPVPVPLRRSWPSRWPAWPPAWPSPTSAPARPATPARRRRPSRPARPKPPFRPSPDPAGP